MNKEEAITNRKCYPIDTTPCNFNYLPKTLEAHLTISCGKLIEKHCYIQILDGMHLCLKHKITRQIELNICCEICKLPEL